MYKVFFKESCFLLTDNQKLSKEGETTLIHKDFNATKKFICEQLERKDPFHAVIYHNDPEDLFSIFKSCFIYVKAAGGAVIQDNKVLFIKRSGIYDLPKGHVEACETIEKCAIREVEEECGIHQTEITGSLTTTLHIYPRNNHWFLKKTYWYTMTCPPQQSLTPQAEEGIEEVFWLPTGEIDTIIDKTYPSLVEVLEKIKNEK